MNTIQGDHIMSRTITAAEINSAVDSMELMKTEWEKNHPDEKMFVCPLCNNIGLIWKAFDEFGNELFGDDKRGPGSYDYFFPCSCIKQTANRLEKTNRKFASVPGLYQDAYFDNYRTDVYQKVTSMQLVDSAKKTAIAFVNKIEKMEREGVGLYIYSKARGSGKSRLASTISNELIKKGVRNKYASASGILSEIQKTWNDKSISEQKIIEHYIEPGILIVDDIGARSGQNWIDDKFLQIIDSRYSSKKITIFTSNYEVQNLPFNDMRIIDRLSDVDRFYVVRMPDETVRTQSRATNGGNLFQKLINEED